MPATSHPTELLTRLGEQVRSLRAASGLTARQAAERAGISLRFYSQLEAGQANIAIGRLARVARALDVQLSTLVDGLEVADPPMPPAPQDVVSLLGLRGAGKSTLGAALAHQLGSPFVELDDRIEEAAGLRLTEIFNLHGEPYYRRLEARCLEEFLAEGQPGVLALPGGIVTNEPALALARARTTTVWLRATPEEHMARVLAQGDHRPIADRPDAMAELRAILAAREPLYRLADVTLDTSSVTTEHLATQLADRLGG